VRIAQSACELCAEVRLVIREDARLRNNSWLRIPPAALSRGPFLEERERSPFVSSGRGGVVS